MGLYNEERNASKTRPRGGVRNYDSSSSLIDARDETKGPCTSASRQREKGNWKPVSLRRPFLVFIIVVSIGLITTLQLLLIRSERDGGIVFAPNVNELPLRRTFGYKYLPTTIAVLYGFLWTWIDIDIRRLEPFYQLSKGTGSSGEQSVLLHYPVDFLASVPVKALRNRHWPVFFASIATVFVFWGITPTQSGIFAINTLNKNTTQPSLRSFDYVPLQEQENTMSASAATSVSNILWLNETLQPFMTCNIMLAPFGTDKNNSSDAVEGNWTAWTTLYSVNVTCEEAVPYSSQSNSVTYANSSWGCNYELPPLRTGEANTNETKIFDVLYVGYSSDNDAANFYLSDGSCPANESQTFHAQISKTLVPPTEFVNMTGDEQRANANYTLLWCRSGYFSQNVSATISLPDRSVLAVNQESAPQALPPNLFNISQFEAAMSMGQELFDYRTNFPTSSWPDQSPYIQNLPLNAMAISTFPKMAAYAIGATQFPMDAYLDPSTLADSYQAAYRVLFARQLANVLSPDLASDATNTGTFSYDTESIILVPSFVFIVEGLLGSAAILAGSLLYWSTRRPIKLRADPSSLSVIMSLAADDNGIQHALKGLDQATDKELYQTIKGYTFQLHTTQGQHGSTSIRLLAPRDDETYDELPLKALRNLCPVASNQDFSKQQKGTVTRLLPYEFKLVTGCGFLAVQLTMLILIGALHVRIANQNGLPLPSESRFVRQLLENYLPTAIGTMIGPFWLVLNRHICMLQPFEDLRRKKSSAQEAIGVTYTAIPPQLVALKALSKGHVLLAALCLMTLLADVLSISLAGLFFENNVVQPTSTTFLQPYQIMFQPLNGTAAPFDGTFLPLSQLKGDAAEPFLMATSNQTANTPMPPWSDEELFYLPFSPNTQQQNGTWRYRATTPVVGAQLQCSAFPPTSILDVTGVQAATMLSSANLTVMLPQTNGPPVTCVPRGPFPYLAQEANDMEQVYGRPTGQAAFEFAYGLDGCTDGEKTAYGLTCPNNSAAASAFCRNHVAAGWVRGDFVNGTSSDPTEIPSILAVWNATIIICEAMVVAGMADVMVSEDGHVLDTFSKNVSTASVEKYFSTSPDDLLGQANQYILDNGPEWHNDSFASDWTNYLIEQAINSSRLLDPTLPPPPPEDVISPFSALYSKLFAILLSRDMDLLFVKNKNVTTQLPGSILGPETRIFMSTTMFYIAETILILYIATTITLYINRPWRILARMPTSPASIIAFFAASNALNDFKDTAGMTERQLAKHLAMLDARYGFGSFIGTDGEPHIGIEKYPFIAPLTREGSEARLGRVNEKWHKRWRRKFGYWRSGAVREGGWI